VLQCQACTTNRSASSRRWTRVRASRSCTRCRHSCSISSARMAGLTAAKRGQSLDFRIDHLLHALDRLPLQSSAGLFQQCRAGREQLLDGLGLGLQQGGGQLAIAGQALAGQGLAGEVLGVVSTALVEQQRRPSLGRKRPPPARAGPDTRPRAASPAAARRS
jgi:hypothetical protein